MQTKQDYAYQVLKDEIATGRLLPGQRIVVNRFAQQIGTSAIPVREALLRLEADGLVTITPHIGAIVTLITGPTIEMTLETLAVMEGFATRLSAPRAPEVLEELRHHNDAMATAIDREEWDRFSSENRAFHFTIYSVVPNTILIKTIKDLWSQLDSFLSASSFYLMPDRARGSVDEHAALLDMLAADARDLDTLERLARDHKLNTARRLRPRDEVQADRLPAAAPAAAGARLR